MRNDKNINFQMIFDILLDKKTSQIKNKIPNWNFWKNLNACKWVLTPNVRFIKENACVHEPHSRGNPTTEITTLLYSKFI